jgi:Fe(3+) dicitrate transport protein
MFLAPVASLALLTSPPTVPPIPAVDLEQGPRRPTIGVAGPRQPDAVTADSPSRPTSVDPDPQIRPEIKPETKTPIAPKTEAEVDEGDGEARRVFVGSLFGQADQIPRIVGSAHAVDEAALERSEHDDVHKVLAEVPGVYVRGEDGFGLRPNIGLRGANSDRSAKVTLLEDGILMAPAPYAAPAAYYFPLTTRMVGLEVFKGPASVRHGPNTIGGAMNLRTRSIPEYGIAHIDLAGGRFGYGKAHGYWGMRSKRGFGIVIEGARVQSSGFKRLDGAATDRGTGFGKNDAMLKLGYTTPSTSGPVHSVEVRGGVANELSHETYLGLSDADFAENPFRRYAASELGRMRWWRTQAQAGYQVADGDLELEARAYRHDFRRAWRKLNAFADGPSLDTILDNPEAGQSAVFFAILRGEEDTQDANSALRIGTNDRRYVSQGLQSAFRWRPSWQRVANELEVGARVHQDSIARDHIEESYWMTSGTLVRDDTPIDTTTQNRGTALAAAFHLYDAVTLADRVTVAPGMRVELISTQFTDELDPASEPIRRFDAVPVPGVGIHVQATRFLESFAGVHRGFSPVSPGQPRDVRPEFSTSYELGARVRGAGAFGEATGFFSDYSNLTGQCTFSAGCDDSMVGQQFNAGRVFVYGVETNGGYEHRLRSGFRYGVGARYTFTGSSFRSAFRSGFSQFGDVEAGDALPYVPMHVGGGNVLFGGEIWEASATVSYNGPMRDLAGQGAIPDADRVDGFAVLDLAGEVAIAPPVRLYATINNATNARYVAARRPFGVRPGAPLTVMIGVKIDVFAAGDDD